jgi:hypothetical protein
MGFEQGASKRVLNKTDKTVKHDDREFGKFQHQQKMFGIGNTLSEIFFSTIVHDI